MKGALAVYAPVLGAASETFITRHLRELRPGATLAVVDRADGPMAPALRAELPVIELAGSPLGRARRLVARLQRRAGWHGTVELNAISAELRRRQVQVLLGEYLDSSHRIYRAARARGLAVFVHGHGHDVSAALRQAKWRRRYLDYADAAGLIVPASALKQRLVALGLPSERVHVVAYGVDLPVESRVHSEAATVRCLAVGRLVGKKAPLQLLEAFAKARLQGRSTLELDYVGDGALAAQVRAAIVDRGLQECVRLHGALPSPSVQALMARADIFVQHSVVDPLTGDSEGLPVAILEAMAHALPVVSTLHAGIPEAVLQGETGYLVAEHDVEAMAARLVELADSADLRRRMGEAGRARARQHFAASRQARVLATLLGVQESAS